MSSCFDFQSWPNGTVDNNPVAKNPCLWGISDTEIFTVKRTRSKLKLILQLEIDDDGTWRNIHIGPSGLEAQYVIQNSTPAFYVDFLVDPRVQPLTWDSPSHSPHTSCLKCVPMASFWNQRLIVKHSDHLTAALAAKVLQAMHLDGTD